MNSTFFIVAVAVVFLIAFMVAYLLLRNVYGNKNPKEWKPIITTEKDTFKENLFPYKGKGKPKSEDE